MRFVTHPPVRVILHDTLRPCVNRRPCTLLRLMPTRLRHRACLRLLRRCTLEQNIQIAQLAWRGRLRPPVPAVLTSPVRLEARRVFASYPSGACPPVCPSKYAFNHCMNSMLSCAGDRITSSQGLGSQSSPLTCSTSGAACRQAIGATLKRQDTTGTSP